MRDDRRHRVEITDLKQLGITFLFRTEPDPIMRFYVVESMFETAKAINCTRGAVFTVGFNAPDYNNLVESGESPLLTYQLTSRLSAPVSVPADTDVKFNLTRIATATLASGIMVVRGYYGRTPI